MTEQRADNELLSIGEMARRTRLTPKALRLYEREGLLKPAQVDPANGYRRYRESQVEQARLIGMLRGVEMGLAEIGRLLADLEADAAQAAARLSRYLAQLETQHRNRQLLGGHIHSLLKSGGQPMFEIQTRHVPAQRVMSMQRRVRVDPAAPTSNTDAFVTEAKAAFRSHLGGAAPAGPFTLIFHGQVDVDHDGPLEAILACPADLEPTDVIGIRTEPAHDEAYTTITKAQWEFPAILAAYDAVAASPVAVARPSVLSCREVYLVEPDAISEGDPICDVAFPLGEPA